MHGNQHEKWSCEAIDTVTCEGLLTHTLCMHILGLNGVCRTFSQLSIMMLFPDNIPLPLVSASGLMAVVLS